MSTLVYMKILEQTPDKYDRGMRIITLGCIDHIKKEITSNRIKPGYDVLEIGCGSGALAAMMTERGASVVGIDISDGMLASARRKAPDANIIHMAATEIEELGINRFDCIVATLSFSELPENELRYVLRASVNALKPGGQIVLADEVPPERRWQRVLSALVRWPLAAITFLLTQNTTHALKGIKEELELAGYNIVDRKSYLAGTLALIVGEKTQS